MSDAALPRSPRRSRAVLMVPAASVLILVLGWSVLWGVARQQALSAMDGWIAAEAGHGRQWSCPGRDVTGFPFRIALSCRDVGFSGVIDGTPAEGRLAGLSAETRIYEPSSLEVTLTGPLSLKGRDDHVDVSLGWSALHATMRGMLGGMKRIELVADDVDLARPGNAGGRADHVELRSGPATGRPADDLAQAVELAVSGAAVPALDAVTGETARLDGSFKGVVTGVLGDLPDLGVRTVERWRADGGRLDVSSLSLAKGALKASVEGRLGLDDQHRLSGRLETGLSGFDALLRRYGISVRAAAIGGVLVNLLGGRSPPPAAAPGTLSLPVVMADGRLAIGPFETGLRLRPLY